jgi:hypothetical protein
VAAIGIPPKQICQIVRNKYDKPIRLPTLLRHFRREIETGATKVNTSVASFIIATILGTAPPDGGKPITDQRVRAKLAIFYARAQLGWQTTPRKELSNPTGPGGRPTPFIYQVSGARLEARLRNLAREHTVHQANPQRSVECDRGKRPEGRLLPLGYSAWPGEPERHRETAARYRDAGGQTGPHRVRQRSGASR